MKLRRRDIGAAILSIFLARIAWNNDAGPDSLSASMSLAFYSELQSFASLQLEPREAEKPAIADVLEGKAKGWTKTALPVPIDLDGDGTVEAIVIPSIVNNRTDSSSDKDTQIPQWGLRVLDLKPLHDGKNFASLFELGSFPFHPRTIFTAGIDGPTSSKKSEKKKEEEEKDGESNTAKKATPSTTAVPIKMTTGQIHSAARYFEKDKKSNKNAESSTDRTRHFFCGTDWHDAANSCKVHCPGGSSTECPDDQRCYADTPCDSEKMLASDAIENYLKETDGEFILATTPGGSLPGVVTLWSDGSLTMHAVTKDVPIGALSKAKKKDILEELNTAQREKQEGWIRVGRGGLELRLLWKVQPFLTVINDEIGVPELDEVDVVLEADSPIGQHGAVIVGGTYRIVKDLEKDDGSSTEVVVPLQSFRAYDAFTGKELWSHGAVLHKAESDAKLDDKGTAKKEEMESTPQKKFLLPSTSTARRRSHVSTTSVNKELNLEGDNNDMIATESCLHLFRASAMDPDSHTFPHLSWGGSEDTQLVVTHFDQKRRGSAGRGGMKHGKSKTGRGKGREGKGPKKGWLGKAINSALPFSSTLSNVGRSKDKSLKSSSNKNDAPQYGKPNVILFRHKGGISALSLRNGRPVCHLSLVEKSLYGDFNGDGVLDQIQIVTDNQQKSIDSETDNADFVQELARRVTTEEKDDNSPFYKGEEANGRRYPRRLCHAMALSGLPAREEIFSVPLCGPAISRRNADRKRHGHSHYSTAPIYPAPSLIVEGSDDGNDIMFATSDGVVTRYDSQGQLVWKSNGGIDGLPTWSGKSGRGTSPEYIGRIDYLNVVSSLPSSIVSPHARPIFVSGEDEMVLLSSGRGSLLARASFPQSAITRPILTKLSSDGTTDIVVVSSDGLWGYKVIVERGGTGFLRVMVGLVFAGIALAALVNRFGNPPGADIRSTDR